MVSLFTKNVIFRMEWRKVKQKVTIQDIADALGVSRNTVSKAINNTDGLAEATRVKILQKAVEMGYKQFSYVQALTRGDGSPVAAPPQNTEIREVALLTSMYFSCSHFASTMLDRLQRELMQLGYRLNTYHVRQEDISARTLPFSFDPGQVSAVVCVEMFDWDYDMMLCELGLPILFIDGPIRKGGRSLPADQLYMDASEIRRLVSGMLEKGVRRIGFVGDHEHCESFYERYLGVCCSLLMAGIPVEDRFIIPAISPADILCRLRALEELPELFVCANDFVAYDTLHALRALGKSVPEDVMLAGFDDAPESRILVPQLTTVHIHTQIIAYSAAQLLISRINEPSLDFRKVYTETELICRESTKYLPFGESNT